MTPLYVSLGIYVGISPTTVLQQSYNRQPTTVLRYTALLPSYYITSPQPIVVWYRAGLSPVWLAADSGMLQQSHQSNYNKLGILCGVVLPVHNVSDWRLTVMPNRWVAVTGACHTALGPLVGGFFTDSDQMAGSLRAASQAAGAFHTPAQLSSRVCRSISQSCRM